jgi:uncharacterized protein (TIGR02147 family)
MKANVFEYTDYIEFIQDWIEAKGHGSKSIISQAAGVQLAYLSLVLRGGTHLNLEQCLRLKGLFEFTPEETEFFLLLAQKNRAGTKELELHFENQIESIRVQRNLLKKRIGNMVKFSQEEQNRYFSRWYYAAIHTALLIPDLRTQKQLEEHFKLSATEIGEALDFLEKIALIKREKNGFAVESFRMHLPGDSSLINQHHTQWRLMALNDLNKINRGSLHYSAIISLSHKDAADFKKESLNFIETFEKKLKDSKDEVLYSMGFDWFEI